MKTILEADNLGKVFYKGKDAIQAVDGVSIVLKEGECLGVVGESGSGKSTLARILARLVKADQGSIYLHGQDITDSKGRSLRAVYQEIQMIFQNPQDSFDPRCTLEDGIMEVLYNHKFSRSEAKRRMLELLQQVELSSELVSRYPHQVSGGQCQRAAIARALAINPKVVICDEATSALDVTVQAQILQLLKKLQKDMGISYIMICHDLALVQTICDRVMVMYQGKVMEEGTTDEVILNPQTEYTKKLIASVRF